MTDLPATWKAVTALVGSAAVGFSVAMLFSGFVGLPDDVAANTTAIEANTQAIRMLAHGDSVIICILTLPEDTRPIDAQRECQ